MSLRRVTRKPLRGRAASLGFVWFALSFGWYGLMLWFPEFASRAKGRAEGAPSGDVYAENLMVALANLPGNVASAFAIDRLGRRVTLAGCMAAAAVAAAAPAARRQNAPVAAACAFNALSVGDGTRSTRTAPNRFQPPRGPPRWVFGGCRSIRFARGDGDDGRVTRGEAAPLVVAAGAMLAGSAAAMMTPLETAGRALEDAHVDGDGGADSDGDEALLVTSRTRSDERIASASRAA